MVAKVKSPISMSPVVRELTDIESAMTKIGQMKQDPTIVAYNEQVKTVLATAMGVPGMIKSQAAKVDVAGVRGTLFNKDPTKTAISTEVTPPTSSGPTGP